MPLGAFLRYLSNESGLSIVASSSLDDERITVEVVNEPVEQVMGTVARRLGAELTRTGNVYFLGTLRPEDRGVLVRRVKRLAKDDLLAAVTVLMSENGRVQAYSDGVVVCADRVEVLQRVTELLDNLEAVEVACWVVQLYLVSLSENQEKEFGLDVVPAVEVAADFAAASSSGLPTGLAAVGSASSATAALNAVLKASRRAEGSRLVAEPLFVLIDGGSGSFERGKRIPIARRAVSDQGTVSTTGYQYVNAGLTCSLAIREHGTESIAGKLQVEMSRLDSYLDNAPVTSSESFNCEAVMRSGGVYLLGCLRRDEAEAASTGLFALGGKKSVGGGVLQVWARAHRIGNGVAGGEAVGGVAAAEPAAARPDFVPLPPVKEGEIMDEFFTDRELPGVRPGGNETPQNTARKYPVTEVQL